MVKGIVWPHQVDQDPSVQDIASIYKAKNGNIIAFLVEDAAPVDRVNMK
jgi:cytochrome c551/c552